MKQDLKASTVNPATTITIFVVIWMLFWLFKTLGYWEDDAFIHAEYARSVFQGRGFSFNGQLSNGDTSPLWVLYLTGAFILGSSWLVGGKILSVFALLLTLTAMFVYCKRLMNEFGEFNRTPFWAIALFVSSPYFCYWVFSGMEAVAAGGLLMTQALLLCPKKATKLGFLMSALSVGIGPLMRPEFILMVPVSLPFLYIQWKKIEVMSSQGGGIALMFAGVALIAAPLFFWSIYALNSFGYVVPNTNAAKKAAPGDVVVFRVASIFLVGYPLIVVLGLFVTAKLIALKAKIYAPSAQRDDRGQFIPLLAWPVIGWSLITLIFYGVNHTFVQTRYLTVLAPGLICVLYVFAGKLLKRNTLNCIALLSLAVQITASLAMTLPHINNKIEVIEASNSISKYISDNLPADAPIAVYSIGQYGFNIKNPIVDTGGITRPGAAKYLYDPQQKMVEWAKNEGAKYYITGTEPEATAKLLYEVNAPVTGWFFKSSEYDKRRPIQLWQLAK